MNVSSSSINNADTTYPAGNPQQIRTDMQALDKALQAGDMATAQSAYQQLQTDAPWLAKAAANASTGSSSNSPGASFAALGSALQSGDVAGAQQAFAQLRQAGHGHHHHAQAAAASDNSQDSDTDDALRTLATALQSGDSTSALSAFSALQQSWPGSTTGNGNDSDPLQNLATALQANNLPDAQDAFLALLQSQMTSSSASPYASGSSGNPSAGTSGWLIDESA